MSLDRLINIDVNSSTAQKRLEKLLETLKKLDGEMDSFGSSGSSNSGLDKPIRSANQYAGVMSTLARDIAKTNGAVSAQERALLKYDNAVRNANKNLEQQKYSQQEYNKAISESKKRYEDRIAAIKKSETATKSGRKTLLDYSGALENEKRLLQQATGNLRYADAATLRYDTAVRKLNKSAAEGRISQTALASGLREAQSGYQAAYKGATDLDNALAKGRGGFRAMRGAVSQLSYQFQDIAVQAQMGTAATTIFTQQFPQIASVFGPAGAVVGVIGAIAGAIAGPLIASMFGAEDATKQLEKSMEALNKVVEKNDKGLYNYTETINKLKRADNDASEIQLAFAILEAEKGVKTATDGIETSLESATGSWYNFFTKAGDVNVDRVSKAFTRLKNEGFELSDILTSIGSNQQGRGSRLSYLTVSDISGIRQSVGDLNETFGLSRDTALDFLYAISTMDSTPESFQRLQSTLAGIIDDQKSSSTVSKEQSSGFIALAKNISDAALQGESFSKFLDAVEGKKIGDEYRPLAYSITQAKLESEKLNSSISESSKLVTQLYDIESAYNELAKESFESGSKSVNNQEARLSARRDFINAIKESVSEEDKFIKRQLIIDDLVDKLADTKAALSKEEIAAIQRYAHEQNFVYEKQVDFNNSLEDTSKILGQIFNQGAKDYADSVKSYNESLQDFVSGTFSKMEDSIVNWAATGKLAFKDFAKSVVEDLLRIQVQQSLAGLATGISGSLGTAPPSTEGSYFNTSNSGGSVGIGSNTTVNAKGNAFDASGQIQKYAKGGITGMANSIQSTPKRFANGSGLLGEAGQPEGIFPLTRTSGGDLGVKAIGGSSAMQVNVNIRNESGAEMQFEQTGQSTGADGSLNIDMVAKMVNRVISSGKADRSITNRFTTRKAVN